MRPRQLLQGLLLLALQAAPARALAENRVLALAICGGHAQSVETFVAQRHPDLNTGIEISPRLTLRPLSLALTCMQSERRQALPAEAKEIFKDKPIDELKMVDLLLSLGANPVYQEPDLKRRTPLHLLLSLPQAQQNDLLILFLKRYGESNLALKDAQGKTPKLLADELNPAIGQFLAKYQPSGLSNMAIDYPAFAFRDGAESLAILRQQEQLLEDLDNQRLPEAEAALAKGLSSEIYLLDPVGRPLLHALALGNRKPELELLLKYKSNLRIRDYDQREVLHLLAAEGQPEQIRWLAARGASLTARDSQGESPLFAAVRAGRSDNLETLLELGADKSLSNYDGQTPLDLAKALEAQDKVKFFGIRRALEGN